MRKSCFLFFVLILVGIQNVQAQKYFTRTGKIIFNSDAPLEKIEASNHKAMSILDVNSGKIEFAVLIKAFQFEKALMQEHFNENYMESDQFPKAIFKGQITDAAKVDFKQDGTYPVVVTGEMTIHGITQELSTKGTITVKDGKISAQSNFEVAVADYKIEIPKVVRENIAKVVQINIDMSYELFEKKKS